MLLCVLFFADDIVLICKTKKHLHKLMNITKKYFDAHKLDISITKSKIMSSDGEEGKVQFEMDTSGTLELEQVISFKYLGVPLNCAPYRFFNDYNEIVKKRAQSYMSRVLSLSRQGADRAELAFVLWNQIALPSILYGCEVCPITEDTIIEVEKCQTIVGKFILQIPTSSANVSVYIDGGFRPIWAVIAERVMLYAQKSMLQPQTTLVKQALNENIGEGEKNWYTRYLLHWKALANSYDSGPDQIKADVRRAAIKDILDKQKITKTSTFAMNIPSRSRVNRWFKPKSWLSDSGLSKIYAQFRVANSGLGNRGPTINGERHKLCPLCANFGEKALNNEVLTRK